MQQLFFLQVKSSTPVVETARIDDLPILLQVRFSLFEYIYNGCHHMFDGEEFETYSSYSVDCG